MAELISAYKPSCCNKAYMSKASAVRHEKKIDVYSNSNGGATILPKMNCDHWERTPKERGWEK